MKPAENLNNLSPALCESALDSTTENNSESTDSDLEILSSGAGDQTRFIQGLRRTIKRKQTQINELTGKLTIAEIHLSSEKEKTKDKEDVIASLKISIEAITQSKDFIIQKLESQLMELQTLHGPSKSDAVTKDSSGQQIKQTESADTKMCNDNTDIEALKLKVAQKNDELNNKTVLYELSLRVKDEHIAKLEAKAKKDAAEIMRVYEILQKFTLKVDTKQDNTNDLVLLNCTKTPSIQFITLPWAGRFAVVFEDLPSAGPGWMVIQRRIDGRVSFETAGCKRNCYIGFGDLSREFWLGCDKIHELTASRRHELYIELVDFDDAKAFARYDHFIVGGQSEHYKLKSLGQYSGNAGDSFRKSENNNYSINKKLPDSEVYYEFFGWWIGAECNLNGKYYDCKTSLDTDSGIWWGLWNLGKRHSLKSCKMLIRPKP